MRLFSRTKEHSWNSTYQNTSLLLIAVRHHPPTGAVSLLSVDNMNGRASISRAEIELLTGGIRYNRSLATSFHAD